MPRSLTKTLLLIMLCTNSLGESGDWAEGLKLPDGAFDEGELLQVPEDFLPEAPDVEYMGSESLPRSPDSDAGNAALSQAASGDLAEKNKQANQLAVPELSKTASGKLKKLEQSFEAKAKTKFARLAEVFESAKKPNPLLFKTDSVALGKCISRFKQETFTPNAVNIYVDVDELLGKQIYFVPMVEENSRKVASLSEMSRAQHLALHRSRKRIKPQFTSLQTAYPKNIPLFELFKSNLQDAFFFSHRPVPIVGQPKGGSVYFRLRGGTNNGKNFLILQRLCPYYPGCQNKGGTVVDYLNYVDPYAYCYYSKTIAFGPDANLHR